MSYRSYISASPRAALLCAVAVTSMANWLIAAAAETDPVLEEIVVEGRRMALTGEVRSASEGVIGAADLDLRPLLRPGDVLEAIPGLIVTQHSGSGKSNQMFLRGFNLDHGTDFATWVDGMPVNMRSHGHGQGYTDINFLIPETIRTIEYVKGPYHAGYGDFASAGAAHIKLYEQLPSRQVEAVTGEYGYTRLLGLGATEIGSANLSAALEWQAYDGAWTDIDEDVSKINGLLRYNGGDDVSSWRVTAMYYDNTWNSADQVPSRAISSGLIDSFGSVDPTLGGNSRRSSLSAGWARDHGNRNSELNAYLIDYRMQLWSNFTYLLDDPLNGDQFEQYDERMIFGGGYRNYWAGGDTQQVQHMAGLELRHDDIGNVGLYQSRARQRLGTTREDRVGETSIGLFYEVNWDFAEHWRTVLGLRGDAYQFDVQADRDENSGDSSDLMISPKASLVRRLDDDTELYLSTGSGFHSNDARGTTIRIDPASGEPVQAVDPLVRSLGWETGIRTVWLEGWNSSLTLWMLELDSELLFVGDAGNTEASRPSRRWGLEFNNFWAINPVWTLEADFAWTHSRFSDSAPEGDYIPGALAFVATGLLTAELPSGWFGALRLRHFGAAPLIEDNSVRSDGSSMAHLSMGWGNDQLRVQLELFNLFDSRDHDIDYFYASRLANEPAEGVEDIHFHVFEPRQARVSAKWMF